MTDIVDRSAEDLAQALREGALSALEVTNAFLDRIEAREADVHAFAHLDPDYARAQATAIDAHRTSGRAIGPLHGLPVGLKDIIDVAGVPAENGSVIDAGRVPKTDSTCAAKLRAAGAVLLGKTVTTEFAFKHPSVTKNPRNLAHSPGGSSSGSAAAVADRMLPLAVGSQTGGSVIRPASYCGVVGYMPSHGLISRTGTLATAPSLDKLGVFANSVSDAAKLVEVLAGHDPADSATRPAPPPRLYETASSQPPVTPMLALAETPFWDLASSAVQGGLGEVAEVLGARIDRVDLPSAFEHVHDWHRAIYTAEFAKCLGGAYNRAADRLAVETREWIEEGRTVLAHDYLAALDWKPVLLAGLEEVFERYDAIVTPAATGAAPEGFATTGDPSFNSPWTFPGNAGGDPAASGGRGRPADRRSAGGTARR